MLCLVFVLDVLYCLSLFLFFPFPLVLVLPTHETTLTNAMRSSCLFVNVNEPWREEPPPPGTLLEQTGQTDEHERGRVTHARQSELRTGINKF